MRACMLFPDSRPGAERGDAAALAAAGAVRGAYARRGNALADGYARRGEERAARVRARGRVPRVRPARVSAGEAAGGALSRTAQQKRVIGLVMEKHGLAVWGETARQCYGNLRAIIGQAEAFVAEVQKGKRVFGAPVAPVLEERDRRAIAAAVMPVIRGELIAQGFRCVLHLDEAPQTLEAISGEGFPEMAQRGVMTPEHILRAGVRPLVRGVGGRSRHRATRMRNAIRRIPATSTPNMPSSTGTSPYPTA